MGKHVLAVAAASKKVQLMKQLQMRSDKVVDVLNPLLVPMICLSYTGGSVVTALFSIFLFTQHSPWSYFLGYILVFAECMCLTFTSKVWREIISLPCLPSITTTLRSRQYIADRSKILWCMVNWNLFMITWCMSILMAMAACVSSGRNNQIAHMSQEML